MRHSVVDLPELIVFALERSFSGTLVDRRGSLKICVSPELEGVRVGVGALEELPEANEEAGQAGDSRRMTGTILSSVMVIPA